MIKKYDDFHSLPTGLLQVAKTICENDEDYGRTFYHPDGSVFVCVGDSNESVDEIVEQLEMIDEIDGFEIENESYPDYDSGWFAIDTRSGELLPWTEGAEHLLYAK